LDTQSPSNKQTDTTLDHNHNGASHQTHNPAQTPVIFGLECCLCARRVGYICPKHTHIVVSLGNNSSVREYGLGQMYPTLRLFDHE
jgi:hypothetical protein